jgi:polynucleotide 5'-hydroxyl-kinase GRC3/NOL9
MILSQTKMSGKRKRSDDGKSSTNAVSKYTSIPVNTQDSPLSNQYLEPLSTNGKPLSAIAAARLKAEASAKGVVTPEITVEPVPAPESSSTLPESPVPELEESEQENDVPVKQLNLKLNNWRNEPQNVLSDTATELTVKLPKHSTIAMIGCFHLKVLRGAININGANIGAMSRDGQQDQYYTAYVPATHPILKIRGLDGTNHVQFINCKEASPLSYNSPLFADIWNVRTEIESNRSFSVVRQRCFACSARVGDYGTFTSKENLSHFTC